MCFNACVSQQEGLLRGIREESWNQHRDLENHSGTFLEKLIQPIEAEWGNSHPSVCNTLFFYWAVFPLSLSLSQSLSLSHTHTHRKWAHMFWVQKLSKQMTWQTDTWLLACTDVATFGTKVNIENILWEMFRLLNITVFCPFFYLLKSFIWNTVKPKLFLYWCYALV